MSEEEKKDFGDKAEEAAKDFKEEAKKTAEEFKEGLKDAGGDNKKNLTCRDHYIRCHNMRNWCFGSMDYWFDRGYYLPHQI